MSPFVASLPCSTHRQGKSGLGLEAHRVAVARFTHGTSCFSEFQRPRAQRHTTGRSINIEFDLNCSGSHYFSEPYDGNLVTSPLFQGDRIS